ncbi:MAG: hypothetical protein MZW92_25830 [Comamonadaceae bacterium]|nr:hypothetical protein [Comamonadaceae bacterium]
MNFIEGENQIQAVGYEKDKKITADSLKIAFTTKKNDKPDNLILEQKKMADGNYLITAYAVDKNGRHCIDFNGRVLFLRH